MVCNSIKDLMLNYKEVDVICKGIPLVDIDFKHLYQLFQ